MRKFSLLLALLCASVMGWATVYDDTALSLDAGETVGQTLTLSICKSGANTTQVVAKSSTSVFTGVYECIWQQYGGGSNPIVGEYTVTDHEISFTTTWDTYPTSATQLRFVARRNNSGGGSDIFGGTATSAEITGECAGGGSCTDETVPTVSAVSVGSITYNSAVLTVTASDNIGVTGYIVKNGASQIASSATSPITITGLTAATTYDNIKVIAKDACNNESAEFAVTSFTTGVRSFCSFATGHLGQANFGDANGCILLTLTKLSASSVGVTVEPNNGGADVFDFVEVILGGVSHTLGAVGGSAPTNTEIVFDGLASLDFSINVLWHNHNWADAGGRWTTNQFSVTEAELCPGPIDSEYCKYEDSQTIKGGKNIALTWETDGSGNVIITMQPGTGTTSCSFRNGGFEGGINAFVVSDDNFATTTPASDYFTAVQVYSGNTYTLTKTADLPANAKIKHVGSGHALAWVLDGNNEYSFPDFIYTYGGTCNQLDAPENVAVDADSIITFDAVSGADTYTAYVSLGGVEKYHQEVTNGGVLHFWPYEDGAYKVTVIAGGAGKTDSDPSDEYTWNLLARAVVLGNSEYCEHIMQTGTNTEAAFTWETDGSGNIVITIAETLGGAANASHFRNNALAIGNFKVGAGQAAGSNYFSHPGTTTGNQLVLTATSAPALGEKIYYHGVVEYATSGNGDAWPTLDFEWTYGTVCSGKAVSATPNDNTMGTAVVQKAGVDVTNVDDGDEVSFIATSNNAELYRFVNWTKAGVEVSTSATYVTTITETTNLIANFEYIRNTYCHTEVTSAQGKKFYLTLGSIGGGQYQIKFEGSSEAKITALNNANFQINGVSTSWDDDGQDVPFSKDNGAWTFDNSGYGSVYTTFELAAGKTWEDIYAWTHNIYFACEGMGEQNLSDVFPARHHIAWNEGCADAEAPVFTKAEAEVLNESSVRLKIQATDNWEGMLTFTIARAGADPIIANHASGEEFAEDVTGLTAGIEYDFTVTVSDGVNNVNTHILATPIADETNPVMGEASLDSKRWNSAIINVDASDNKGVVAYYIVELDDEFVPDEGKITVEGLTASTSYTFTIKAKDAAGNLSGNTAEVSFTTDAHSLVPTTAAPVPTWPAAQVKSIYSDAYDLAPAHTPNYNAPWWSAPAINLSDIDGDHFMDYDLTNDGMIGWQYDQISVASMEKVHIDIYASAAGTLTVRPIIDGDGALNDNRKTLTLVAQQWKSFDIELTEFGAHDWTKLFQFSIEYWAAGGLLGEHISVDNVYFYRTTELVDNEKPTNVSAVVAKSSFGSITLNVSGEDNSNNVLYSIKIGDTEYANGAAASGANKTFTISGLTPGTSYNINVIASDESGNEAEPVIVVAQTVSITPAPVPTCDAAIVLSVYSDAYESALAHDFSKNTWTGIPYSELNISGDHLLAYTNPNLPAQMPDIAWGNNNDGADAIIAKDGLNDGTNKGLDVRAMNRIHFDIWSATATTYPELRLNDTQAGSIVLDGSGWQSFDLDISSLTDAQKSNIRWIKFIAFRDPAPEDIVIDNVYFWIAPDLVRDDDWMAPGELGTICIPNGAIATGGDIYELVGKNSEGKIVFATVANNQMVPGKPYLFEATSNAMKFYYTAEDAVGNPVNTGAMKGTFADITLPDTDLGINDLSDIYYFADHALWSCADISTLSVPANRAYVKLSEVGNIGSSSPAPGRRYITMGVNGKDAATGFDQLNASDAPMKMIIDGQLFILRGEKLYDATGRLVK
ncbi:MAG: hypothetical protein IKP02_05600 [Paludibacteraceae bacterium]|nr:hypothetical protein [Paludibacteraceae bacterium]